MPYHYFDPSQENDPFVLPNVETFTAYPHECRECESGQPVIPDYYGLLYLDREECRECGRTGTLFPTSDTRKWYYAFGQPGYMWDSEFPSGPFDSEAEALADARDE